MNKIIIYSIILISLLSFNTSWAQSRQLDNRFNPKISVNSLFLAKYENTENTSKDENPNGAQLQEIEVRLYSNIDSYFRGEFTFAVEKEEGEFGYHPEEAFIESLSLPVFKIKFGKFLAEIGKHNSLHTHAFPFVDNLLANELIFGEEGFNETGLSVSYLAPFNWYFETIAQVFSTNNSELFDSENSEHVSGILFLKSLWELSPETTYELNGSYGLGKNITDNLSSFYNLSMTYKRTSLQNNYRGNFSLTSEYLSSEKKDDATSANISGISAWFKWQMARRWWVHLRGEFIDQDQSTSIKKYTALAQFKASEFSIINFQVDQLEDDYKFSLQLNFNIGTHPTHSY